MTQRLRIVNWDYSSPWAKDKAVTRPGMTVEPGGNGLYVWATIADAANGWKVNGSTGRGCRLLLVEHTDDDILGPGDCAKEVRLRCGHIVRELDQDEIRYVRQGGSLEEVAAATVSTTPLFLRLLPGARDVWTYPATRMHGVDHWHRVAIEGVKLANVTAGADADVVQAFAALHDCQRLNDGTDREHGPRAAAVAAGLLATHLNPEQIRLVEEACRDHTRGRTTSDPTIGCCWDADRLDLARIGTRPETELLSTQAARDRFPNTFTTAPPSDRPGEPRYGWILTDSDYSFLQGDDRDRQLVAIPGIELADTAGIPLASDPTGVCTSAGWLPWRRALLAEYRDEDIMRAEPVRRGEKVTVGRCLIRVELTRPQITHLHLRKPLEPVMHELLGGSPVLESAAR